MKLSSIVIAISIVACWGLNAAIGKIGVMQFPPLAFLTIRFVFSALIFLPFAKVNKSQLKMLFLISLLLNVLHMGFIFVSFKFLSASSASVLQQCEVPMAIVLACLFGQEKINAQQILGVVVSFLGILCIFGIPDINMFGLTAALLSGIFWAFAQLSFKRAKSIDPCFFLAYTSLFSIPFLGLGSYLFEDNNYIELLQAANYKFYISLAYQVLILGVAMMMWQRIVAQNGINKAIPFTLLHIVFGIMGGMIFFDDTLNIYIIGGALLIVFGVALSVFPKINFITILQKLFNHNQDKSLPL